MDTIQDRRRPARLTGRGISASDPQTRERALRFGQQIKALRKALGLTQEQLAHKAGCDRQSVNSIENAAYSPSLARVLRIADALGRAPGDLFAGMPAPNGDHPTAADPGDSS